MNRLARSLATAIGVLAAAASAGGHDFWISASKFRPVKGEPVDLTLLFGVEYEGTHVPRSNVRIEKFVILGPGGVEPIPGEFKADPAGRVTPASDGTYVVAYRSKRQSIELEAKKFEEYLKEEGLERVSEARVARKETDKAGREVFSRCAKTILSVGAVSKEGHDRVAGMRLEIVPETNPYTAAAGDDLAFRVVFEEKPLEGGLVVARSRSEPKHTVTARTDAKGRVTLKLDRAGEWMLKCVHMVPAAAETAMDWESLWASVTFDLAARAAADGAK